MIEVEGQIKKWGNSIGFRMKKSLLRNPEVKLNARMKAILIPERGLKGKDLWGIARIKKSTEQIMKEIDDELDIDF